MLLPANSCQSLAQTLAIQELVVLRSRMFSQTSRATLCPRGKRMSPVFTQMAGLAEPHPCPLERWKQRPSAGTGIPRVGPPEEQEGTLRLVGLAVLADSMVIGEVTVAFPVAAVVVEGRVATASLVAMAVQAWRGSRSTFRWLGPLARRASRAQQDPPAQRAALDPQDLPERQVRMVRPALRGRLEKQVKQDKQAPRVRKETPAQRAKREKQERRVGQVPSVLQALRALREKQVQ